MYLEIFNLGDDMNINFLKISDNKVIKFFPIKTDSILFY